MHTALRSVCLLMLGLLAPGTPAAESAWSESLVAGAAEQARWAARYEHGEGVEQDYRKAVRLYCAAARAGDMDAQYALGWLYANGRGVSRDDGLAAAWFRLAARQGDVHAARMLERLGPADRPRCLLPAPDGTGPQWALQDPPRRRQLEALVHRLAPDYQLDPRLVLALISAESGFRVQAVSAKNAQGLMQLIPATAARFGVADPFDPVQNLHGGMAYLQWLLAYFGGDVRLALAGYNAGEQAVERYQGVPPYAETQAYVKRIMAAYGFDSHPITPGLVEPSTLAVAVDPTLLR